jgi:hypothetical protein
MCLARPRNPIAHSNAESDYKPKFNHFQLQRISKNKKKTFTECTSTALLSCIPLVEETSQRAWNNQGSGRDGMVCGKQRNSTAPCSLIDLLKLLGESFSRMVAHLELQTSISC